jgi:methyl-accepting chemotaxis protein
VIKKTEKTPDHKLFIICLVITLILCAAAAVSLFIQIRAAGTMTAENAGFKTAGRLLFWGGILHTGVLVLGLWALLFFIRVLINRFHRLKTLVKPLAEKDVGALLRLPKPDPPAREGFLGLKEAAALEEALWSWGKLFESLNHFVSKSQGLREIVQGDSRERDTIHRHLGEVIDKIAKQFFEIESSAMQAVESLGEIEGYIQSFHETGKNQSAALEDTEHGLARASDLSEAAASRIRASAGKAETLAKGIGAGEEYAQEVHEIVKNISRQVEGISEITAIINQISEQTNILSMNAAIESAHAGQAGAGFAVVAEEIRKLADSTRENAGRIHDELLAIIKNTREALKASETSSAALDGITGGIGDLSKELTDISSSVMETGAINGELSSSIQKIAASGQHIKDSGADLTARHRSFRTSLELIHSLSDTTRAEIKEIHSGTREILDNIRKTQDRILENLDSTGQMNVFLSLPQGAPEAIADKPVLSNVGTGNRASGAAAPARWEQPLPQAALRPDDRPDDGVPAVHPNAVLPAGGINAAAAESEKEGPFPGSRDVAVKRPPQTIL